MHAENNFASFLPLAPLVLRPNLQLEGSVLAILVWFSWVHENRHEEKTGESAMSLLSVYSYSPTASSTVERKRRERPPSWDTEYARCVCVFGGTLGDKKEQSLIRHLQRSNYDCDLRLHRCVLTFASPEVCAPSFVSISPSRTATACLVERWRQ